MSVFEHKEGMDTLSIEQILSIQLTEYLRRRVVCKDAPEPYAYYSNSKDETFPYITYRVCTTNIHTVLDAGKIMIDDVAQLQTDRNVFICRKYPGVCLYESKEDRNHKWSILMRLALVPCESVDEIYTPMDQRTY